MHYGTIAQLSVLIPFLLIRVLSLKALVNIKRRIHEEKILKSKQYCLAANLQFNYLNQSVKTFNYIIQLLLQKQLQLYTKLRNYGIDWSWFYFLPK